MLLRAKVKTCSSRNFVRALNDGRFEVWVKAKPEKGLANQEAVAVLAKHFNLEISKIKLIKGAKEKNKIFSIKND